MIQDHLQRKLCPLMAFYLTLFDEGYTSQQALDFARKESKKVTLLKKQENEKFSKMPCAFLLYRLGVKGHMKKIFYVEGWDTEWVSNDK